MIFATILISSLPVFTVEFPVSQLPAQFEVSRHTNELGAPGRKISASDPQYTALVALLREERRNWNTDYASYVPHLVFNSKDMQINCVGKLIVLNYRTSGGELSQISKTVSRPCPGDEPSIQ